MEEHQLGEHFWNFLTKPKSKPSYGETEVECGISTIRHNDFKADEETGHEVDQDYNFCNDFEGMEAEEEIAIRDQVNTSVDEEIAMHKDRQSQGMTTDYSYIEVPEAMKAYSYTTDAPKGMKAYSCTVQGLPDDSYTEDQITDLDYGPFVQATREGTWSTMKEFLKSHPQALVARLFRDRGTALHHTLHMGSDREEIAACLVDHMTPDDLEIVDDEGFTPLALAAQNHHPQYLLQRMVDKNSNLPNIGDYHRIPIAVASWKGFKDTTRFLYRLTHKNILSPEFRNGRVGVELLHHCINMKLFDIASELVEKFPRILLKPYKHDDGEHIYPMHAFAKTFSDYFSGEWNKKISSFGDNSILKYVCHLIVGSTEDNKALDDEEVFCIHQARGFLQLVCRHLLNFDIDTLKEVVGEAMIEASKEGNIEFITEMLKIDRELISAQKGSKNMFWHAVENRQEKVFNLIYGVGVHKDTLLSQVNDGNDNILHHAAKLPHSSILDRIPSPALQMQRELQWFQEVSRVAKSRYRRNLNKDKFTPSRLFNEEHKDLLNSAETSMKDTAKAASTVGALIITTMFGAAFINPGGKNQGTSNSSFLSEICFNIFIVCDALSLCSSSAAILVFLGILTSRYSKEDFLSHLPWKFMIGFSALFTAIATMMIAFYFALAITLEGRVQLVVALVFVLLLVPVMFYQSSICPLLCINFNSTHVSIFDRNTKLPKSRRESIGCCY